MTMNLFKYTFDQRAMLTASDDNVKFPIKGAKVTKHNGRKGSYVTPYRVGKNYTAQFRLSITSSPNFRYRLDSNDLLSLESLNSVKFLDNRQNNLGTLSSLKLDNLPRVWPSYGYFGGARELFVEFNQGTQIKLDKRKYHFKIPGRRDFYHSDDDEEVKIQLIKNILQGMQSLLGQDDLQSETGNAKITQFAGVAINIEDYRKCNVNLTASIAYKDLFGDSFVKCWLNAWNDDEVKLRRNVFLTQDAEYFFKGISIKYLSSLPNFSKDVFLPLYSVLKNYIQSKGCFKKSLFYLRLP